MRQSPWKVVAYAIIVLCGILAVVPNFISREQLAQLLEERRVLIHRGWALPDFSRSFSRVRCAAFRRRYLASSLAFR